MGTGTTAAVDGGSLTATFSHIPSGVGGVVAAVTETSPSGGSGAGASSTGPFSGCLPLSSATSVTPEPGRSDTASGAGFSAGEPVDATLHSTPIREGTVTATSAGVTTVSVKIPATLAAGHHNIILTGETSKHTVTIPITVTPRPQAGLLHLLAPKTLLHKRVSRSTTVRLKGRDGIPRTGAGHVLVLVEAGTNATVDGHRVATRTSSLQVLPVSAAAIKASRPGKVTLVAIGWYAAEKSTTGDVLRAVKPSHINKGSTLTAGSHGLPFAPALDGVVLSVTSKSGRTTLGGIAVPASSHPTTVVCRVIDGAVAVHLAEHASVTVTGWYGTPAAAAGGKTTG